MDEAQGLNGNTVLDPIIAFESSKNYRKMR